MYSPPIRILNLATPPPFAQHIQMALCEVCARRRCRFDWTGLMWSLMLTLVSAPLQRASTAWEAKLFVPLNRKLNMRDWKSKYQNKRIFILIEIEYAPWRSVKPIKWFKATDYFPLNFRSSWLEKVGAWVLWGCHDKLLQTRWLKAVEIHSLTVWSHEIQNQGADRAIVTLKALAESFLPFLASSGFRCSLAHD